MPQFREFRIQRTEQLAFREIPLRLEVSKLIAAPNSAIDKGVRLISPRSSRTLQKLEQKKQH